MAKILIIDDDQDFVAAVGIVLEKAGYTTVSANSRHEGMEVFEKENPDLVILDVMMDEPDEGFTMAQELKKKSNQTPILMLTSVSQVTGLDFDKDSEMVPVDVFEQKPIMPDTLLARVKELLSE